MLNVEGIKIDTFYVEKNFGCGRRGVSKLYETGVHTYELGVQHLTVGGHLTKHMLPFFIRGKSSSGCSTTHSALHVPLPLLL